MGLVLNQGRQEARRMFVMANAISSALTGQLSLEIFEAVASDSDEAKAAFTLHQSRTQQPE